jgi:hypothetical protein
MLPEQALPAHARSLCCCLATIVHDALQYCNINVVVHHDSARAVARMPAS